jgi:hypothetical protein
MSTVVFDPVLVNYDCRKGITKSSGKKIWKCKVEDQDGDWAPVPGVSKWTDGMGWPACWQDNLICTNVSYDFDGVRQPEQSNPKYRDVQFCYLTAEYETFDILAGVWTYERRGKFELLETGIGLEWDDGILSDQKQAINFYSGEIVVSRLFNISSGQIARLEANQGSVNNSLFVAPWDGVGYAAECLLYKTYDCRRITLPGLGTMNEITLYFEAKPASHNIFWREGIPQRSIDGFPMYDASGYPLYIAAPGYHRYSVDIYPTYDFLYLIIE